MKAEIAARHPRVVMGGGGGSGGVPERVSSHRAPVGPSIPGHIISVAGQSVPHGLCPRPTHPKRFLVCSACLAVL
jgi:hypothetical protein